MRHELRDRDRFVGVLPGTSSVSLFIAATRRVDKKKWSADADFSRKNIGIAQDALLVKSFVWKHQDSWVHSILGIQQVDFREANVGPSRVKCRKNHFGSLELSFESTSTALRIHVVVWIQTSDVIDFFFFSKLQPPSKVASELVLSRWISACAFDLMREIDELVSAHSRLQETSAGISISSQNADFIQFKQSGFQGLDCHTGNRCIRRRSNQNFSTDRSNEKESLLEA